MGEELYPGHAAELKKHAARVTAIEHASANPLPGPLLDAYAHVPQEIAGFKIRALVHYDFVLLKQLDSPLLQQLAAAAPASAGGDSPAGRTAAAGRTPFTDEQSYDMIWQFCRHPREVRAELAAYTRQARAELAAKAGGASVPASLDPASVPASLDPIADRVRELFRERALEEIGFQLNPVEAALLVKAVEREFIRAFSTVIKYESRPGEPGETFTPPPPQTTTASAGGSTTSAV